MALKVDTIQNPSSTVINLTLDTSGNVTVGNALTIPSTSISGNLTFTGAGNRITGDFSNATVANRVMFQSSTTNGNTLVRAIPNGTSNQAGFQSSNSSDPANSSVGYLISTVTDIQIGSAINGTGTYLPMTFLTGGSERMRIDTSGNVGIGTSSPATNSLTNYRASGYTEVRTASGVNSTSIGQDASAGYIGTNTNLPLVSITNGTERMRIDSSGNVGIGTSSPAAALEVSRAGSSEIRATTTTSAGNVAVLKVKGPVSNYGMFTVDNANYLAFYDYTANAERMRIDANGNLLVGQTSYNAGKITVLTTGNASMSCAQTGTTGDMIYFRTSTNTLAGYIQCPTGTTTTYASVSDYRLKENVIPIATGLEKILALKPVTYDWIGDKLQGEGFIAHELQEVIPLAVAGKKDAVNEDGSIKPQGVDPAKIVVHLVAAIQELSAKVAALEAKT